jgi:hypothetical protein
MPFGVHLVEPQEMEIALGSAGEAADALVVLARRAIAPGRELFNMYAESFPAKLTRSTTVQRASLNDQVRRVLQRAAAQRLRVRLGAERLQLGQPVPEGGRALSGADGRGYN